MTQRTLDPVKENKEWTAYVLFYFFITSFLLKTVFGIMSGSKFLLVSGIFALVGIFTAVATLIRIGVTHPGRGLRRYYPAGQDFVNRTRAASAGMPRRDPWASSPGKLEFMVVLGVSVIMVLSTGALLFSISHMVFFHALYPPELSAAWMATVVAALNLSFTIWINKKIANVKETETSEVMFVLNTDFMLSILAMVAVVLSRMGAAVIDYACAILTALGLLAYSVSYLYAAFQGLMDASCDRKTVSAIEQCLDKVLPQGTSKTLRVNKVGHVFEIIAILTMGGDSPATEVLNLIKKIKDQVRAEFQKPHEILVGVRSL